MNASGEPTTENLELMNSVKKFYGDYLTTLDQNRPAIDAFYNNDAKLVFDGQFFESSLAIKEFWRTLPESSHSGRNFAYNLCAVDGLKTLVILNAGGLVKYKSTNKIYTQTMVCSYDSLQGLKICSDDYRICG